MGKKAVVLSGGGARGAYQAGAWKALRELNYDFDIVTGTSVGALNAAMMASGDYEKTTEMWTLLTPSEIMKNTPEDNAKEIGLKKWTLEFVEKAFEEKSFDQTPLLELLKKTVDIDKIYDSDIELGIVATKYPGMEPVKLYKNDIKKENLIDYLMASSACFPLMKPYMIDGENYIDGGFNDNMPVQMAIDKGATEIVTVSLNAIGKKAKANTSGVNIIRVEPKEDLGFILYFNSDYAKVNMQRGYYDTLKAFNKYEGWSYTFENEAMSKFNQSFVDFIEETSIKLITDGILGKVFRKHISMNIIKTLARQTSASCLGKSWVIPAVDIAGKIFNVNPLKVYTKQQFDNALSSAFYELPDLRFETNDMAGFFQGLTDEKQQTKIIYSLLQQLYFGESIPTGMIFAADAAPKALIAAFYLMFITLK